MNKQNAEHEIALRARLKEVQVKLDKVEEGFVLGRINEALYKKYSAKYNIEKNEINTELQKLGYKLSNLNKYIDFSVTIAGNLNKIWASGNYQLKQKIQYLMFTDGILYDKKDGDYVTQKANTVFSWMLSLTKVLEKIKADKQVLKPIYPLW